MRRFPATAAGTVTPRAYRPDGHPRWIYWPERRIHTEFPGLHRLGVTGDQLTMMLVENPRAYFS